MRVCMCSLQLLSPEPGSQDTVAALHCVIHFVLFSCDCWRRRSLSDYAAALLFGLNFIAESYCQFMYVCVCVCVRANMRRGYGGVFQLLFHFIFNSFLPLMQHHMHTSTSTHKYTYHVCVCVFVSILVFDKYLNSLHLTVIDLRVTACSSFIIFFIFIRLHRLISTSL